MKIILAFAVTTFLLSCKQKTKNDETINYKTVNGETINEVKSTSDAPFDFLAKKSNGDYQLSVEEEFPEIFYKDSIHGDVTIFYIAKKDSLQTFWEDFGFRNNIFYEAEPDDEYYFKIDSAIKKHLEPNISNYHIIAEYVNKKYFDKKSNLIFPYVKEYYIKDTAPQVWKLLKKDTIELGDKNYSTLAYLNKLIVDNNKK